MQADRIETRSDARRRQVLTAAAECFRREGFHATSIARISQVAGMSPGHIYHYFANKELIVEALVEQEEGDFAELLQVLGAERGDGDLLDGLVRRMEAIVERILDPRRVSLSLEIAAEAARNPRIAALLQDSDRRMARRFGELADADGIPAIAASDDGDGRARREMLPLLLSGLALRSLHNPQLDRARMAGLIKETLAALWRRQ